MDNNLFKISLDQGKKFNNYQTKIKKSTKNIPKRGLIIEGFVNSEQEMLVRPREDGYISVLENQERSSKLVNSVNQPELDEFLQLQSKYNDLIQQYTLIQKSINDKSLTEINRLSSNNPYLGKNIIIGKTNIMYVNKMGIAKWYPNSDIWNVTAGKNGCASQQELIEVDIPWNNNYMNAGATIPTTPPLITGIPMTIGESCGNEGLNVYASKLISNPIAEYIGCYNDKQNITNINVVPVLNSSNNVNSFISSASSVYMGNNDTLGAWAAFDQNPNTFWHSEVSSATNYNASTGVYEGTNGITIVNVGTINGEFLQITMPSNIKVNKYSLAPRLDLITTRSPNSWYIIGLKDNQWTTVDRQINQQFTNSTPKTYNISNPGDYSAYVLLVDKVGNDDQTTNRNNIQVAELNLFMNSVSDTNSNNGAMIWNQSTIGYTSYDKCQDYAVDNGYQYFGLQDYKSDGTAACLVSNDLLRTQMYGDGSKQLIEIPIWSSNTSGSGVYVTLGSRGRLFIKDNSDNLLWQSSETDPINCSIDYSVSDKVDSSGNNLTHLKDTTLDKCQSKCTDDDKCYGIAMNISSNNECWLKSQFQKIESNNNMSLYKKIKSKDNCNFLLLLQNDGNMCIYQGSPDNIIQPPVWTTLTTGKQLQPNTDWEASKGSFGRNYIIGKESLATNQWIGSNNGSMKLIMQSDGNLVLYTSEKKVGCVKGQNDKIYGNSSINAVYKLNTIGNKQSLGKVAYIDAESNLREYPDSMLGYTNDYQIYQNTDSPYNDITSMIVSDESQCQNECNNNPDCGGYTYMASTNTCWLKDRNSYPKADKYPQNDMTLGVRNPGLTGSTNCSNQIVDIDTVQYANYVKGEGMTPETQCKTSLVSQADRINFDNIKAQLSTLGNDIASKMESLYNQDNQIYEKLNMNSAQFKKELEKYKNINIKIRKEMELQSNNNIEGMTNLNMNDINGMLSDADLRVLQGNYSYIMWSILAVGILTITINTMKK